VNEMTKLKINLFQEIIEYIRSRDVLVSQLQFVQTKYKTAPSETVSVQADSLPPFTVCTSIILLSHCKYLLY
jgi:hypothetical protein